MTTQASRAEDFINSIGINTHLDFRRHCVQQCHRGRVGAQLSGREAGPRRDAVSHQPGACSRKSRPPPASNTICSWRQAPRPIFPRRCKALKQLPASDIEMLEGRNEADLFGPGFQQGIADQVTLYQFARQNFPGIPVIQESFAGLPDYGARRRSIRLRRLRQRPHLFRHRQQSSAWRLDRRAEQLRTPGHAGQARNHHGSRLLHHRQHHRSAFGRFHRPGEIHA